MNTHRRWAKWLLGDYALYHIYTIECKPVPNAGRRGPFGAGDGGLGDTVIVEPLAAVEDVCTASDPALRNAAAYLGPDSYGLGVRIDRELVAACFLWTNERYRRQRNFWPLGPNEAKLVQVVTAERFRGRRYATALCRTAPQHMATFGFHRLFARVWHSHTASIRAFEHAGWRRAATVLQMAPWRRGRPWRFVWNRRVRAEPSRRAWKRP